MSALIQDLDHYTRGLPISVGPPSILYKVRRFVSRNKKQVLVSSVLALAGFILLGGIIASSVKAREERIAREAQRVRAEETEEFFEYFARDIQSHISPELDQYVAATVDSVLHRWNRQGFGSQENEDSFRALAVEVYLQADRTEDALEQLALIRQDCAGLSSNDPRRLKLEYAELLFQSKQQGSEVSDNQIQELLEKQEEYLGVDHSLTLKTRALLVDFLIEGGQFELAKEVVQRLIELRTQTLGEADELTIDAQKQLTVTYGNTGEIFKEIEVMEYCLQLRESTYKKLSIQNAVDSLILEGRCREAKDLQRQIKYREKYCINMEAFGKLVPGSRVQLAELYRDVGNIDEAIVQQKIAIKQIKTEIESFPDDYPEEFRSEEIEFLASSEEELKAYLKIKESQSSDGAASAEQGSADPDQK